MLKQFFGKFEESQKYVIFMLYMLYSCGMVNGLRGSSDFDNECIVQQFHGFLRIIKYKFMMS